MERGSWFVIRGSWIEAARDYFLGRFFVGVLAFAALRAVARAGLGAWQGTAGTLPAPPSWFSNTASLTDDGTTKSVTLPATNPAQFFRLRRP